VGTGERWEGTGRDGREEGMVGEAGRRRMKEGKMGGKGKREGKEREKVWNIFCEAPMLSH